MEDKNIEWGKEIVVAANEVAEMTEGIGVPGIGLLAKFAQYFYDKHLQNRFAQFITEAEVDQELIDKILADETYSNCFYAVLETIRQTHSRIGLVALALIYKEHWSDEAYLIAAMRSFSQVSDRTLDAFISLYDSVPSNTTALKLHDGSSFHELYNEAVELIRRNFFVMSTGVGMHANGPIQGMKWDHTESYYNYCRAAKARL